MRSIIRWHSRKILPTAPQALTAQKTPSPAPQSAGSNNKTYLPDLLRLTTQVAKANADSAEDYFWIDDHTLLFLRLAPWRKGVFRAVVEDTITGKKTLPRPFNVKNRPLLLGLPFSFTVTGSRRWRQGYRPPNAILSPNGQWLLWPPTVVEGRSNPDFLWVAASLDGKQQVWKQMADPASERRYVLKDACWLRDSTGWVDLVTRYVREEYALSRACIYRLGAPDPVRIVEVEGMPGKSMGLAQEGQLMLYHPPPIHTEPTEAVFSLIDLEGDAVRVEPLMVPIPNAGEVWRVTLSPQGDRLAWVLHEIRGGTSCNVLYVSQWDGTRPRPLGSVPFIETRCNGYASLDIVRWLPDGSRLSVRYNKAIYTVAV